MLGVQWSPRRSSALGYQYKYLEELVSKYWMVELEEREGPHSFLFVQTEIQFPKPIGIEQMWPRGELQGFKSNHNCHAGSKPGARFLRFCGKNTHGNTATVPTLFHTYSSGEVRTHALADYVLSVAP